MGSVNKSTSQVLLSPFSMFCVLRALIKHPVQSYSIYEVQDLLEFQRGYFLIIQLVFDHVDECLLSSTGNMPCEKTKVCLQSLLVIFPERDIGLSLEVTPVIFLHLLYLHLKSMGSIPQHVNHL